VIVRLALLIAVLIILAALLGLAYQAGKRVNQRRKFADARGVDPDLYHRLGRFVRGLLTQPTDLNTESIVVLPPARRTEAEGLAEGYEEAEKLRDRARQHLRY
jgi:hypothetical protein